MARTFLNTRVTPNIKTCSYPTNNTNKWSRNSFLDPEDDVPWDEQDLSSKERGHVYLWKEDSESWIHVFMPFKVMDHETSDLLRDIKSYRSTKPYINGKSTVSDKFSKNHKSCLQNFRLTKEHLSIFKERVKEIDGLLEKDEVDVSLLVSKIKESINVSMELSDSVRAYRESYCSYSGTKLNTEEKKNLALKEFSNAREKVNSLALKNLEFSKELDKLSKEVGRETSYIEADEWFTTLSSKIESLRNVSFSRFEREIIHKHRIDTGYLDSSSRPPTLMSLSRELDRLRSYYPSLQKIKSQDASEDTIIEFPGLTITLSEDGTTKVVGDPGILKAYVEGSVTAQSRKRRKRSIHTKGDK